MLYPGHFVSARGRGLRLCGLGLCGVGRKSMLLAGLLSLFAFLQPAGVSAKQILQGQGYVDPFGKAWQVSTIEHCTTLAYAEDVWNSHRVGGFPAGRRTFHRYKEEFDSGASKCTTPSKPIKYELVRVIDSAPLQWPLIGDREILPDRDSHHRQHGQPLCHRALRLPVRCRAERELGRGAPERPGAETCAMGVESPHGHEGGRKLEAARAKVLTSKVRITCTNEALPCKNLLP